MITDPLYKNTMQTSIEDIAITLKEIDADPNKPIESIIQLFRPTELDHPVYGKLIFNHQMFIKMKENFDNDVRRQKIAIDFDHNGEKHAAGWIKALEVTPEGLFALVEWTPLGVKAIKNKEYLYISPDYKPLWTDPETGIQYQYVLFGAALTNRPTIKGMMEVKLSENQIRQIMMDFCIDNLKLDEQSATRMTEAFLDYIGGEKEMDNDNLSKAFDSFIKQYNKKEDEPDMNNEPNMNNEQTQKFNEDTYIEDQDTMNEPGIYLDEQERPYVLLDDGEEWDIVDTLDDNTVVLSNEAEYPGILLVGNVATGEAVLLSEDNIDGYPEIVLHDLDTDDTASIVETDYGQFIAINPIDDEPSLLFSDDEDIVDLTEYTYLLSELGVPVEELSLDDLLESSIELAEEIYNMEEQEDTYALDEDLDVNTNEDIQLSENEYDERDELLIKLSEELETVKQELAEQKEKEMLAEQSIILSELEQLVNAWATPDEYGRVKITPAQKDKILKLMATMNEVQLSEFIETIENGPSIQLSEIGTANYIPEEENIKLSEIERKAKELERQGYDSFTAYVEALKHSEHI